MASATATARSDKKAMIAATAAMDSQSQPLRNGQNVIPPLELEFAECDCCGLAEECTLEYIGRVRERFGGRWICGLCTEAVKDEAIRSEGGIDNEEALGRHMKFCEQFRSSSPPANPTEDLISAVKQLLRRTLDSPRKPGSVCRPMMVRSKSCFSALSE
ncbi:uncharacterized protein LOC115741007 isoform X2 [Rhodamnia argentea]|nr:uncharacterized protein LOC115741007 isoform X2 [Rhodamnia argentea]